MDADGKTIEIILRHLMPVLNRNVTVFFSGAASDPAALMDMINGMLLREASVVVSESFGKIAPAGGLWQNLITDYSRMRKAVRDSYLVLVPALTRNTLAKAAVGIQDNLVTNGLSAALMSGIPVIAVKDNYDPDGQRAKKLGLDRNPAYNAMLREHEKRLESFGVRLVDGTEFSCAIKENLYPELFRGGTKKRGTQPPAQKLETQTLITYQDVSGLENGAALTIPGGAVVTPLAREFLSRRGIRLDFV